MMPTPRSDSMEEEKEDSVKDVHIVNNKSIYFKIILTKNKQIRREVYVQITNLLA